MNDFIKNGGFDQFAVYAVAFISMGVAVHFMAGEIYDELIKPYLYHRRKEKQKKKIVFKK